MDRPYIRTILVYARFTAGYDGNVAGLLDVLQRFPIEVTFFAAYFTPADGKRGCERDNKFFHFISQQ